jgi:hypothetical protein
VNDVLHLAAGGLFALGWVGIGVHAYGKNRLYARQEGTEGNALALAAYGPVVTVLTWCVAGALELAARVVGP